MKLLNCIKYKHIKKEFICNTSFLKTKLKSLAYTMCDGYISQNIINSSIQKFTEGYIYRDTKNNDNIIGFVLWKINKYKNDYEQSLYIYLICGKGIGELALNDVEWYVIKNKITYIEIEVSNKITQNIYITNYRFKILSSYNQYNILYKKFNPDDYIFYIKPRRRHTLKKE
jgi:hypothetical protein